MKRALLTLLVLTPIGLAAAALAQEIRVDGSSTVYPITLSVAEDFGIDNPGVDVSVAFSGTGGGFTKFCSGETQVQDASRVIKPSEVEACAAAGIEFVEIPVAFDALTVVVNPENDWATCLTTDELRRIWEPGSDVTRWSDVRPDWPAEEIELFAPGVDSGTFDYFTEAIVGEGGSSRTDFFPSEDDTVLVQGVEGNPHALAYFGYAYFIEEGDRLRAVEIDGGEGCVAPSTETIESGAYRPLSRPLFVYVRADAGEALDAFVRYYLSDFARDLIAETGYAVLDPEAYELSLERWERGVTGSAFLDPQGDSVIEVLRNSLP